MSILIYSGIKDPFKEQLLNIIEQRFPGLTVECAEGIKELRARFRRPVYDVDAAVLVASSKDELNSLMSIESDLFLLPLIVIVPDGDPDTFYKAHRLRPRYVTSADGTGGFMDVSLVLDKMIDRSRKWRKTAGGDFKTNS